MAARRFVLTTMFSAGDVVPFVRLGERLRARGHDVTLVTHAPFRALAEAAGLTFATWDTDAEHAAMMADGALFEDVAGFATIYERHVIPKLPREAAVLRDQCDADTVLVTRCGPALAARVAAEQRGAILVEAYLGPGHVSPAGFVDELVRPWHAAIAAVRGHADRIGPWLRTCDARFGLWPAWWASPEPHWPPALELVGFAPASEPGLLPPALATVLAAPRPLVVLACGTGRFFTPTIVDVCARVVAARGGTLLVVTPFRDLVRTPLAPGVHWVEAAPYAALFSQVDVVLHHGGIGTIVEGLRAGIPQVALGTGGDRPVNARGLERLGLGRYVPPAMWSDAAITRAVDDLLSSADTRAAYALAAERARSERETDPSRWLERVDRGRAPVAADVAEPTAAVVPTSARVARLLPAQRALLAQRLRDRGGSRG